MSPSTTSPPPKPRNLPPNIHSPSDINSLSRSQLQHLSKNHKLKAIGTSKAIRERLLEFYRVNELHPAGEEDDGRKKENQQQQQEEEDNDEMDTEDSPSPSHSRKPPNTSSNGKKLSPSARSHSDNHDIKISLPDASQKHHKETIDSPLLDEYLSDEDDEDFCLQQEDAMDESTDEFDVPTPTNEEVTAILKDQEHYESGNLATTGNEQEESTLSSPGKKRKRPQTEISLSPATPEKLSMRKNKKKSRKRKKRKVIADEEPSDSLPTEPINTAVDSQPKLIDLRLLNRRKLQTICKRHSLKANTSKQQMLNDLFSLLKSYFIKDDSGVSDANISQSTTHSSPQQQSESAVATSSHDSPKKDKSSMKPTRKSGTRHKLDALLERIPGMKGKELKPLCKEYGIRVKQRIAKLREDLVAAVSEKKKEDPSQDHTTLSPPEDVSSEKSKSNSITEPPQIDTAVKPMHSRKDSSSTTSRTSKKLPVPSSNRQGELTVEMIETLNRSELEYYCGLNHVDTKELSEEDMRRKLLELYSMDILEYLSLRKDSLLSTDDIESASRKNLIRYSKKFNLKANGSTEVLKKQLLDHMSTIRIRLLREQIEQSPEKSRPNLQRELDGLYTSVSSTNASRETPSPLLSRSKKQKSGKVTTTSSSARTPVGKKSSSHESIASTSPAVSPAQKANPKPKSEEESVPDANYIQHATRKDIQKLCKEYKLGAVGKTDVLRQRLLDHLHSNDKPVSNEKAPSSSKKSKKTASISPKTAKSSSKTSADISSSKVSADDTPVKSPRKSSTKSQSKTTVKKKSPKRKKFVPPRMAVPKETAKPASSASSKAQPASKKKRKKAEPTDTESTPSSKKTPLKKRKKGSTESEEEMNRPKKRKKISKSSKDTKSKSSKSKKQPPSNKKKNTKEQESPETPEPDAVMSNPFYLTPVTTKGDHASIKSPSSLRKRVVPTPGRVQFSDSEPQTFEYSCQEDLSEDSCCLCHDDAPDGSTATIVCDSCLRRYHRSCVELRHGTDLDARDRKIPFVCLICLTGSTRASRRFSYEWKPKVYHRLLRAIMDLALLPVRPRKNVPGLMDDGMDFSFWTYLEPVESRLPSFKTLGEFRDALFGAYKKVVKAQGAKSAIGKEAKRLQRWFSSIFDVLEVPMDEALVSDVEDGEE